MLCFVFLVNAAVKCITQTHGNKVHIYSQKITCHYFHISLSPFPQNPSSVSSVRSIKQNIQSREIKWPGVCISREQRVCFSHILLSSLFSCSAPWQLLSQSRFQSHSGPRARVVLESKRVFHSSSFSCLRQHISITFSLQYLQVFSFIL